MNGPNAGLAGRPIELIQSTGAWFVSSIWTQRAVESEALRARRRLWRAVEAQHIASTLRLVASVDEQLVLERLLEQSKPPLPPEAGGLHYLLATPFRYSSPIGSRFRAAADSGIWYGAEAQRTACAELGYWRWRSCACWLRGPSRTRAGIDVCGPPRLLSSARIAGPIRTTTAPGIRVCAPGRSRRDRYESVRDPGTRRRGRLRPCFAAGCWSSLRGS